MVDVGAKPATSREAVAECVVRMAPETVRAVREATLAKGDAISVARVAGRIAANLLLQERVRGLSDRT